MKEKYLTWEEVKNSLKFTPEEKVQIQFEEDKIDAVIKARKNK